MTAASRWGAASSDAEDEEGGDHEHGRHDPEPDDDLRLVDAERLVVVVERGHPEDPLALAGLAPGVLEIARLDDDRERLEEEDATENGQQELLLDHDRERPDGRAEGEAAGVAHEDLG